MKKNYITFLLCFATLQLFSQNFGNEWINYNQRYFKFKIFATGVYRIDSTTLANAGVPLGEINPKNLQIFGKGKEIPIWISGEEDDKFNTNDFIEFYAEKNNGWLDSLLYNGLKNQPNPYYSLITDTASYFLTWNNQTNNKRLTIETDIDKTGYTANPYILYEEVLTHSHLYQKDFSDFPESDYLPTKGWMSGTIPKNTPYAPNLNTSQKYDAGPNAKLELAFLGLSYTNHRITAEYRKPDNSYVLLVDTIFNNPRLIKTNHEVPTSTLVNGNTNFRFISKGVNDVDQMAFAYIKIVYPRTTNMSNVQEMSFRVPDNPNKPKTFLQLTNFNDLASTTFLYDLTNAKRIVVNKIGSTFEVLVPNGNGDKLCYFASNNKIKKITTLTEIKSSVETNKAFTNFNGNTKNLDLIIITHKKLWASANEYKNYKQSTGLNTAVFDIAELYDQFAYGISKHPIAIKQLINFITQNWTTKPHIFLLGKGLTEDICRTNSTNFNNNLVPTYGVAGADMLFSIKKNNNKLTALLPVGRLAAKTDAEVLSYLNKVKEYESNAKAMWMKNIMHFGGGKTQSEQNIFKIYLNNLEKIAKDTLLGANVMSFFKQSTNAIEIPDMSMSNYITQKLVEGTSLLTFFSHAAGSTIEFGLEFPWNYNNKGKYPFMLTNSCYTGDIYTTSSNSANEQAVLIPNKGIIGYLSTAASGNSSEMYQYSLNFYKQISYASYGKSIGNAIVNTINNSFNNKTTKQMFLHGDPSIKMNYFDKPDLFITEFDIIPTKNLPSTKDEFLNLKIALKNQGKAFKDTFLIDIKRTFADGTVSNYSYKHKGIAFIDTLSIALPMEAKKAGGNNLIRVDLNTSAEKPIDESNYANNSATLQLYIQSDEIVALYPPNYAVLPTNQIKLTAITKDVFPKNNNYIFEIDTTPDFNSTFKITQQVAANGNIITYTPTLLNKDSLVYYWRVAINKPEKLWSNVNSFQKITNQSGWGQSVVPQINDNQIIGLKRNSNNLFDFVSTPKELFVRTIGNNNTGTLLEYRIDAEAVDYGICYNSGGVPAIHVAVLDPMTLKPWESYWVKNGVEYNADKKFSPNICRPEIVSWGRPDKYFVFKINNQADRDSLRNMINKGIPDGHYVIVWTVIKGNFSLWEQDLKDAFSQKLGATQHTQIADDIPYIFVGKKGYPSMAKEIVGKHPQDTIILKTDIKPAAAQGMIESVKIGPVKSWQKVYWQQQALENPTKDSIRIQVKGINKQDQEVVLINAYPKDSVNFKINHIDAKTYPYLKLNIFTTDKGDQTPAQLKNWYVLAEQAPEMVFNTSLNYLFHKDTLQEGDNIKLAITIENVSNTDADSLLIKYWIIDANNKLHNISYPRQKPLLAGQTLKDTISYSTIGLQGANKIWVEINPNKDQIELDYTNNLTSKPFVVVKDKYNPILDVTFDGQRIIDGEIVSPKPFILISLKDENPYLALNDTTNIQLYLTQKNTSKKTATRVYFSNPAVKFIPAKLPENQLKIEFTPEFTESGTYELAIVATDRSLNYSGNGDGTFNYKSTFVVETKSTITQVVNYPNPFSTSTRFVFNLTGSEIPSSFKIQIYNLTGKLVKEITETEIGPLRIGRNMTEYAWDGTDEFGDKLANGVYFYKVVAKINGQDIEHKNTNADKFFKNGFGKMYLMR